MKITHKEAEQCETWGPNPALDPGSIVLCIMYQWWRVVTILDKTYKTWVGLNQGTT